MGGTINQLVLSNGLRMVHRRVPGATEYCGLTVNVGSRDELSPERFGLAHFVEHALFKGTQRRSDSYILNRMEAVGGELNAFTTKEETTIYSAMPAGSYRRACVLIGELVADSVFPAKKLLLEREVICDEIDSYLDSPSEAVFDSFDEVFYAGSPLAHNILGTKRSVMAIGSETCRAYLRDNFTAENSVYFYLGPESLGRVASVAERAFAGLPAQGKPAPRVAPVVNQPARHMIDNAAHQSHTVMGVPIGGLHSADRHVMALATNIIGGPGMNSLLNLELREHRGLVYTVEASTALLSDCGMMTIYFGCDHNDLLQCIRLVADTLHRFAARKPGERLLAAAKRQYIGQLTLGHDNKEQLALSSGRAVLHGLEPPTLQATVERLQSVSAQNLRDAAERLAEAPLRILTLC